MTWLARMSLANRSLVALAALVVIVFGAIAVPSLKQELFPSLEFPAATVVASYPGASPDLVEEQVTKPLEGVIQGTGGLSTMTSTSREGSASVQIQFEYGTDVDGAVNEIQQGLNRVRPQLPADVEPEVVVGSIDALPAVILAASADGDQRQLVQRLESSVVPELKSIDGVRDAAVTGARDENVTIKPDPAKLAAARLTPSAISTALSANGVSIPAGSITDGNQTLSVQVGGPITSLDQLKGLFLTSPSGAPVRLDAVATVTQVPAPATSITRTNGKDSLGVSVTLAPNGTAVDVSHAIKDKLPGMTTALGAGGALTVVFDQAPFIEQSVDGLTTEGLLGLAFAVLVILIFLMSVRSTLVTAVSIPLSVLVALIALWAGDESLNILTLGALTIAIGRVVDDSIVVLENIKRHLSYGEDKHRAVLDGVREVAGAVTASTLTTVAVFLPIALVGGLVGQLFSSFALTVAVALLASWLVALTVIPVLAYWFLKPTAVDADADEQHRVAVEKEQRSILQRVYLPALRFVTRRRKLTVALAVLIFLGTLGLVPKLETNFLDSSGQNTLSVHQELPPGTSLSATDAAAKKVETVLGAVSDVESYQVTIGSSGGAFAGFGGASGEATTAEFSITLKDGSDSTAAESAVRERVKGITDAGTITVGAGGGGGGFNTSSLEVNVQAGDQQTLAAAADQVRRAVASVPGTADVTSDLSESAPRIQATLNREAASRYGLTDAMVGQIVAQAFQGSRAGQITVDGQQRAVIVLNGAPAPTDLDQIRALQLPTPAGPVRLGTVAQVTRVDGPVQIKRIDGARTVTVNATATSQNVGAVTSDMQSRLETLKLPAGATYSLGGVSAQQSGSFGDLGIALLIAIAIVFLIMVATFRSLAQPLILLVSIPFAATGALLLLLATDTALGVPALIGMLMLIGIVVTNAIVLMDLINQYRRQGMSVHDAVLEGGRRRLRPILMTASATICALIPMALGLTGGGGFISRPLAIVVIGGLISSTLLTLLLVPTIYTIVESVKEKSQLKRVRRAEPPANDPVPPVPADAR
ncbi:efflux RND transporter permease subunit [Kribbella sp. CA-245084]|uniref:efflux RND transporter permease subunit n=1 Tax=Kribbella sp. CA-245084 TaxID=3239940 RepID=UPI003D91CCC3